MARQSSHRATPEPESDTPVEDNGALESSTDAGAGAGANGAADDRMRRAEELVDRAAQRVGDLAARLGQGILRLTARAREEAEDMWAEARDIARGEKS
jgi:hypothetical protein